MSLDPRYQPVSAEAVKADAMADLRRRVERLERGAHYARFPTSPGTPGILDAAVGSGQIQLGLGLWLRDSAVWRFIPFS